MTCYQRHMRPLFETLGLEYDTDNRRLIDRALRDVLGVDDAAHCPEVWAAVKAMQPDAEVALPGRIAAWLMLAQAPVGIDPAAMWTEFLASGSAQAAQAQGATYSEWHFGTGGAMADELVALVLIGRKRATAGSLWAYEAEGEAIPQTGEYSVVLDGSGGARCILRTVTAEVVAFGDVGEEFAAAEGEGDLSLAYWRAGHERYFTRELEALGRAFSADMPVVCERFEVVWP